MSLQVSNVLSISPGNEELGNEQDRAPSHPEMEKESINADEARSDINTQDTCKGTVMSETESSKTKIEQSPTTKASQKKVDVTPSIVGKKRSCSSKDDSETGKHQRAESAARRKLKLDE